MSQCKVVKCMEKHDGFELCSCLKQVQDCMMVLEIGGDIRGVGWEIGGDIGGAAGREGYTWCSWQVGR